MEGLSNGIRAVAPAKDWAATERLESKRCISSKDLKEDLEKFRRWREARELEIAKLPCVFCHKVLDCSVECMEKNEMIRIGKEQGKDINQIASEIIWKMKMSSREETSLCEDEEEQSEDEEEESEDEEEQSEDEDEESEDEEEQSSAISELQCDSEIVCSNVLKKAHHGSSYTPLSPPCLSPPAPESEITPQLPPTPNWLRMKKSIQISGEIKKSRSGNGIHTFGVTGKETIYSTRGRKNGAEHDNRYTSRQPHPPSIDYEGGGTMLNMGEEENGGSMGKRESRNGARRPPSPPSPSSQPPRESSSAIAAVSVRWIQTAAAAATPTTTGISLRGWSGVLFGDLCSLIPFHVCKHVSCYCETRRWKFHTFEMLTLGLNNSIIVSI